MADRCEMTDLLATECAHCSGATIEGDPADLIVAYTLTARYDGQCSHCGNHYTAPAVVARLEDREEGSPGGYICSTCTRKAQG